MDTSSPPSAVSGYLSSVGGVGVAYFVAFVVIIIIVLGVTGNIVTIVSLARSSRLRSPTAAFIASLCVADFIFCVVNLPFSASRFAHGGWVHGSTLCVVFPFLRYVNVGVSLLTIAAIAANRYILIVHPQLYDRIYRRSYVAIMIALIWLFSFAMLLPTLIGKWGRFGFDETILNCSILEVNGRSSKTFLFILGFLVPCFAIIICYFRIFWVLQRSRRRIRKHSFSITSEKDPDARKRKEELVITRMILIIFCSFLICYLPITIVKVADKQVRFPVLHLISYLFIYMSACINPIIYGATNHRYRKAFKLVLLCRRAPLARESSVSHTRHDSSAFSATAVPSPSECEEGSVFDEL